MPGSGQRPQSQPTEVDLVPVRQSPVRELPAARPRCEHGRALVGGQLNGAAQEVGVQVGVGGIGDLQAAARGLGPHRAQVAARIDGKGAAVREVHEIGRVAQALVDDRDHGEGHHDTVRHSNDYWNVPPDDA